MLMKAQDIGKIKSEFLSIHDGFGLIPFASSVDFAASFFQIDKFRRFDYLGLLDCLNFFFELLN